MRPWWSSSRWEQVAERRVQLASSRAAIGTGPKRVRVTFGFAVDHCLRKLMVMRSLRDRHVGGVSVRRSSVRLGWSTGVGNNCIMCTSCEIRRAFGAHKAVSALTKHSRKSAFGIDVSVNAIVNIAVNLVRQSVALQGDSPNNYMWGRSV